MVDWGDGRYEDTATALAPVAELLAERLAPEPGLRVLDVACGTGNGALELARRGVDVLGVDASERLVEVARERAQGEGLADRATFAVGDVTALPVEDDRFDSAISVFGVIFAPVAPAAAELRRAVRRGGRIIMTAWLPGAAISSVAMLMASASGAPAPASGGPRWSDPESLSGVLGEVRATEHTITFTADSPDAWLDAQWADHPLFRHVARSLESAALDAVDLQARAILHEANEDPSTFATTSRYLVLEARA